MTWSLKYIPVDVLHGPSSNPVPASMDRIGTSVMPVLITDNSSEFTAAQASVTTNYEGLQQALDSRFSGINIPRMVIPACFRDTDSFEGYNHYGLIAPAADVVLYNDPAIGGNLYYRPRGKTYAFRAFTNLNSGQYPDGAIRPYAYTEQGTQISQIPCSNGTNNTHTNRSIINMAVLLEENGIFTQYMVVYWVVTGDGSTDAQYRSFTMSTNAVILSLLNTVEMIDDPTPPTEGDPYDPGGFSGSEGGTGSFDDISIDIPVPPLPTISAVDAGFITLFAPTAAELKSLASYMWSSGFDLDTFKLLVANPMDCILGLSIVPKLPATAGSKEVKVGNIGTGISLPYLSTQYVELDCGTLDVQEFSGSYLDYSPYTKISLYLPYIGIVPLDIDDTMNKAVHVVYHVDVLSGALVAYVLCGGTQLYTYIGQCSSNVPITSHDFSNTINGILGIAGSIGSLAITGGASAPTEAANIASNAINALKPNVQKSGALSGTGGLMGVQYPYLICQRPRLSHPEGQNTYTGYPTNMTATLSALSGYTEVDRIHLDNVPASQDEIAEIMQLLESGVII